MPYLLGNFPERWFWSDLGQHIGENGQVIPPESPPTELDYFDNKGSVGLVGCRSAGGGSFSIGGFSAASGVGELVANFAVEKAAHASNYAKINGFRSEIDGLGHWLDLWAHRTMMKFPKDGTPMSVTTTMEVPPDIRLAGRLNLRATVRGNCPELAGTRGSIHQQNPAPDVHDERTRLDGTPSGAQGHTRSLAYRDLEARCVPWPRGHQR